MSVHLGLSAGSIAAAGDADKPALNEKRADVLEQLMTVTKDATQRDAWGHQLADTISAAVQAGGFGAPPHG